MQRYSSAGPGLFASQQDACRNPCLRVRTCVYIYTPHRVYTVHTQGHNVHMGLRTLSASRRLRGSHSPSMSHSGPQDHGTAPQCVRCCTSAAHTSQGSTTLPCIPVGSLGTGFVPVHSLPQAPCRVLPALSSGDLLPWAEVATGLVGTAKAGRTSSGLRPETSAAQDGAAESCRCLCGWLWPSDPMFTQGG